MALLTSELYRIKAELGFNVLTIGALPYIGIASLFEQVIAPYMSSGATTTSSTAVTAATDPTLVTLVLASATGFDVGARIIVDVDDAQEIATARSLSGSSLSLFLSKAHPGTYPVTVEGGESIIRELLREIRRVKTELAKTFGEGSLKKVDEIEFYQHGDSQFGSLGSQLAFWRDELARVLGIRRRNSGGGNRMVMM